MFRRFRALYEAILGGFVQFWAISATVISRFLVDTEKCLKIALVSARP